MISSYFSRTGLKRNHSSTSDESDISISSENDNKKQEKKRMNTVVEDSDMAVQTALDNISKRLNTLATKVDVEQMRDEVKCLTKTFMEKLEKLEGRLFETEVKAEKLESEVKSLKKVNETATGMVRQQDRRIKQNERELNDLQQYSRSGICECSRCQRRRRRLQPIAQRRCVRSSVTRLASRSPPATSRWPTGQDNAAAPEQGPFLCDSSIVRRETALSPADATSRTKVLLLGKT